MEVQLAPGKAAVLADPTDMRRFSVTVAAPSSALAEIAAQYADVLTFDDEGHAWVATSWIIEASNRGDWADWRGEFEVMRSYAAKHGWTREDPPAIRGHVVWQG